MLITTVEKSHLLGSIIHFSYNHLLVLSGLLLCETYSETYQGEYFLCTSQTLIKSHTWKVIGNLVKLTCRMTQSLSQFVESL